MEILDFLDICGFFVDIWHEKVDICPHQIAIFTAFLRYYQLIEHIQAVKDWIEATKDVALSRKNLINEIGDDGTSRCGMGFRG